MHSHSDSKITWMEEDTATMLDVSSQLIVSEKKLQ